MLNEVRHWERHQHRMLSHMQLIKKHSGGITHTQRQWEQKLGELALSGKHATAGSVGARQLGGACLSWREAFIRRKK